MRSLTLALAPVLTLLACTPPPRPADPLPAPPAPSASAPAPSASAEAKPEAPAAEPFPTKCASNKDNLCLLDDPMIARICKIQSTDVALAMLRKGTPWSRGYLRGNTEAWNASDGGSSRYKMMLDEEVLVMRKRAASAMMVGQGAGFDVIRWDGSCVTLSEGEITLQKPPKPRASPVSWKELSGPTRDALSADGKVGPAYDKRRKECKGATSGDVTAACEKADRALSDAILDFIRNGGEIPTPKLP